MIFRTSLGVGFSEKMRKEDSQNAMFRFLLEFYLETQWKSTLFRKSMKEVKKVSKGDQKGKDLPIETGQGEQRCWNSKKEVLFLAGTVVQNMRLQALNPSRLTIKSRK